MSRPPGRCGCCRVLWRQDDHSRTVCNRGTRVGLRNDTCVHTTGSRAGKRAVLTWIGLDPYPTRDPCRQNMSPFIVSTSTGESKSSLLLTSPRTCHSTLSNGRAALRRAIRKSTGEQRFAGLAEPRDESGSMLSGFDVYDL
jgi:hypothetical protein